MRGSNLLAVGSYNQTLVLDLIRRAPGGASRTEIAEQTGLTPQTVGNVVRRLTSEGLVAEGERVSTGPGKPRTLLHLDAGARYAIGVHLDPVVNTLVVVDLRGGVVAHEHRQPSTGLDPEAMVRELSSAADALVDRAGLARDKVIGLGVAVPGPLDGKRGRVLNPPLLTAWHNVDLKGLFAQYSGLPTTVEKDVIAALTGELWLDSEGELAHSILVYYGAGIGAAAAVDGKSIRGRSGNSGDVGHLVVEKGGPPCPCGQRGCWGVSVAPERILARVEGRSDDDPAPMQSLDALEILRARLITGDARSREAIETLAHAFATGIVLVNDMLDATTVVIGGPVWTELADILAPAIRSAMPHITQMTTVDHPVVRDAVLGSDLAATGAACLVLDALYSARPSGLLIGD